MAIQFLNTVDLNFNQLEKAAIENLSGDPAAGVLGQIYYNTTAAVKKLKVCTTAQVIGVSNAVWTVVGSDASNATITLTPGTGLTTGGFFTLNQADPKEITFNLDYSGTDNFILGASTPSGAITDQFILAATDPGNVVRKITIANIVALAAQGDITEVKASILDAELGIKVTAPTGPVPIIGLDINGLPTSGVPGDTASVTFPAYDGDATDKNVQITLEALLAASGSSATITLSGGAGLLDAGGDFVLNQTGSETISFSVGAGTGIVVNANDVALDYSGTDNFIIAAQTPSSALTGAMLLPISDSATNGVVRKRTVTSLLSLAPQGVVESISAGTYVTVTGTAAVPIINAEGTEAATASKLVARDASGFGKVATAASGSNDTTIATTAFVQAAVTGLLEFKGGFNANSGELDDGSGNDLYTDVVVAIGDYYVVTTAGNFFGNTATPLTVGDSVIAQKAAAAGSAVEADFIVVQSDTDLATASTVGIGNVAGTANQIGVAYSAGTGTITNLDRGSSQNIFKNVAASFGTAVADNNNDTLAIVGAGSVSTSVSGDTLTITGVNTQGALGDKVSLTGGSTSGGLTTFTYNVTSSFTGAVALDVKCEVITAAGQTVYADVTRSGTTLSVIFSGTVADAAFEALLTYVG